MPGPKATSRAHRAPAPNSPNRKTRARLERRQAEYAPRNLQNGQQMHMPGSQNRSK